MKILHQGVCQESNQSLALTRGANLDTQNRLLESVGIEIILVNLNAVIFLLQCYFCSKKDVYSTFRPRSITNRLTVSLYVWTLARAMFVFDIKFDHVT